MSTRKPQPLDRVEWVAPETLRANDYNPNRVFTPEMELLRLSILTNGWTQPIVVDPSDVIVDGFHRWTLGSHDAAIRDMSDDLVPIVRIDAVSAAEARAATVRHNRARGQHGILRMGEIVRAMRAEGVADEKICTMLGMEDEELERLADERPSPERVGMDSFGKAWVPVRE